MTDKQKMILESKMHKTCGLITIGILAYNGLAQLKILAKFKNSAKHFNQNIVVQNIVVQNNPLPQIQK